VRWSRHSPPRSRCGGRAAAPTSPPTSSAGSVSTPCRAGCSAWPARCRTGYTGSSPAGSPCNDVARANASPFVRRAEEARELVTADPARARAEAEAVLAAPEAGAEARSIALRALAVESRIRGDARGAERAVRDAVAAAERAGSAHRTAQARLSLVMILVDQGRDRKS